MTVSEVNLLIGSILGGIGSLITLYLTLRSRQRIEEGEAASAKHTADIEALQKAVATYQIIITEKDKLIEAYKKELDDLLLKCDTLQAKNEALSSEIEKLKKRIFELEKN